MGGWADKDLAEKAKQHFGDLWRTLPVAESKEIEQMARLARRLLPAHRNSGAAPREGALYHDIRRHTPHLFAREE